MFRKKTAITLMSVMTITAAFLSGCGNSGKSADSAIPPEARLAVLHPASL